MPELAKAYEPQQVEDRLYAKWQDAKTFRANPNSGRKPYSIVMPPPNVTGKLTLGHVLNNTIQDILARKARLEGKEVLWLPGTDHAGLATQTAVEKHIRNTEKKTRHDFTREEFVARIWKWKDEFGGIITQQLRKIGASCDWSRERFTLDDHYARAVQGVFVQLYEEGLIYRGLRMVNWCPGSLTALSDEEVIATKQKGLLYYVKYELLEDYPPKLNAASPNSEVAASPRSQVALGNALVGEAVLPPAAAEAAALRGQARAQVQLGHEGGSSSAPPLGTGTPVAAATPDILHAKFLVVATTRPETIMADVALAVRPGGKWAHLIGRKVWRPLHREAIPIIADDAVEEGFGTGVLKVTPAHDKVDYEIGKRHHLAFRDILTPNGRINDPGEHDAAELHGLDRFDARKRSAEMLKERGLLEKEEPYENNIGVSERAGVPIEPRLSEQWFLKYPNVPDALALVRNGHVKFHPAHWTKTYENWLGNIQDWCISRQVWWGHRIPVWYCHSGISDNSSPRSQVALGYALVGEAVLSPSAIEAAELRGQARSQVQFGNEGPAEGNIQLRCQIDSPGEGWTQDPDSLDTWFSSWLWAYETMRTDDGTRKKFYPTSALVTGPDIIFLWVARMLIAGLHFKPNAIKSEVAAAAGVSVSSGGTVTSPTAAAQTRNAEGAPGAPPLGTAAATSEYSSAMLEANLAFKDVYFTGLIRDNKGRKLSKSLGNSPDPLDLIAKYGADGLRFGLVRIAPQGADIRFDEKQIEEGRNFCNKLWNIARFRTLQGNVDFNAEPWKHPRSIFADELLDRLHFLLEGERNVNAALAQFNFSEAASLLYDFVWNDFAARFVEAAKGDFNHTDSITRSGTLATFDYVMSHVLRLLHPFAPFVTEELWCELGFGTETIQTTLWPTQSPRSKSWSTRAQEIYMTADAGRQLRGEVKLPSNQKIPFLLVPNGLVSAERPLTEDQIAVLTALLNGSTVQVLSIPPNPPGPKAFTQLGELYLPATGLVDPALEKDRLAKELAKVEKDLESTRRKLGDANMLAKAPPAKVEEWRALDRTLATKEKSLRTSLDKFE